MNRLTRLQAVAVAGLGVAGALCIASDIAPWAVFDAMPYRHAVDVTAAIPGLDTLLGVVALAAAGLVVVTATRLAAVAASAAALAGTIVAIVQSRLRVGAYLEQAAIVQLPNRTIHTKTAGTLIAVGAAALLLLCACLLATAWMRARPTRLGMRRASTLVATAVTVTAGALLLGHIVDPYGTPMWSLGVPTQGT